MKNIYKAFVALVGVFTAGLVLTASVANAQTVPPRLQFVVGPHATDMAILEGNQTVLTTTVQNISDRAFSTHLCVEDITAGRHLGCVPDYTFEPNEVFKYRTVREFSVDDTHAVKYTYLDPNGQWYEILDSKDRLDRAHFTVAN